MKYRSLYISALLLLSVMPAVEVLAQKQEYKLKKADELTRTVPDWQIGIMNPGLSAMRNCNGTNRKMPNAKMEY
jgi:hypothetical protein